ncbi:unnamed protein product [Effrenium voratum]|nr:unnamed protein product [Effrenium voratum]
MRSSGNAKLAKFDAASCAPVLEPGFSFRSCEVGFATLAVLCSRLLRDRPEYAARAKETARKLLPNIEICLPKSFWPLTLPELQGFLANEAVAYDKTMIFESAQVKLFPSYLQRCIPLKTPSCWNPRNVWPGLDVGDYSELDPMSQPQQTCRYCCDPGFVTAQLRAACFDSVFTEAAKQQMVSGTNLVVGLTSLLPAYALAGCAAQRFSALTVVRGLIPLVAVLQTLPVLLIFVREIWTIPLLGASQSLATIIFTPLSMLVAEIAPPGKVFLEFT